MPKSSKAEISFYEVLQRLAAEQAPIPLKVPKEVSNISHVPFDNSFPKELDGIVLDYLHPYELKKISEIEYESEEDQKRLQIPAKNKIEEMYQKLLANLVNIIEKHFALLIEKSNLGFNENAAKFLAETTEIVQDIKTNFQYKYNKLCEKIQPYFGSFLLNYDPTKVNFDLIKDCVLHFRNHNAQDMKELFLKLCTYPEKTELVEYLINKGLSLERETLLLLVATEFPLRVICLLSDDNKYGNVSCHKQKDTDNEKIVTNVIFYGALHKDIEVFNFLIARYANEHLVNQALENLMLAKVFFQSEEIMTVYNQPQEQKRYFTHEVCHEAINKILKATQYLQLDKKIVKECLSVLFENSYEPEKLEKMYYDHVNAGYLNDKNSTHTWMSKKIYTSEKIKFIEMIQERLYEFFAKRAIEDDGKDCYAACVRILDSDIFSTLHEANGVRSKYRKKLEAQLQKMMKTPCASS